MIGAAVDRLRRWLAAEPARDAQLNTCNLARMRTQPPAHFEFLRFDSNNDCNLRCTYCHNGRSKDIVEADDLRAFLELNVLTVESFQVGCVMEPTLDPRLCDLMRIVRDSPGRPTKRFMLQTNGILLHRHDHHKLRDAGLTCLAVSIDSADPATHALLRGGSRIEKVAANLAAFKKACPGCEIAFITTVTRANVAEIEALVAFGLDLGAREFTLREVFHWPDNGIVDHGRMEDLVLAPGEYAAMRERVEARFGRLAVLDFADQATLDERERRIKADSLR